MPTRRQALIGISSAAIGGAAVSAGAFSSSVEAGADMRIVVVSELRLEPARPDDEVEYVRREDGEIVIEIKKLNQCAFSEFANLVRVINDGDITFDELQFEFGEKNVEDEPAADTLEIISDAGVTEDNGVFTLYDEEGEFPPGEDVVFGIAVDLLPSADPNLSDLPDGGVDIELTITALSE